MKNAEREFTSVALELEPIVIPPEADDSVSSAAGTHDFPTLDMPQAIPSSAAAVGDPKSAARAERLPRREAGEVDLRGLRPPFALLRALPQVKRLNSGGQLRITVDDQAVLRDFIDLCTVQGHALKTLAEDDSGLHFTLTHR